MDLSHRGRFLSKYMQCFDWENVEGRLRAFSEKTAFARACVLNYYFSSPSEKKWLRSRCQRQCGKYGNNFASRPSTWQWRVCWRWYVQLFLHCALWICLMWCFQERHGGWSTRLKQLAALGSTIVMLWLQCQGHGRPLFSMMHAAFNACLEKEPGLFANIE